ncbi:Aste57867_13264 [Aphanomyces stellatus]|uniref:Aste57867_13264 protein n=1 Tax=Aphanomyces stellatus TaxID=120398 RepID=A0A485KXP2_9STRA|nr:hypothetical protein As57867_013215 [Aphanomyces stellatus]VFT90104.1 Aste57867_13264 [Aphanomyces stellatus]
MDDGPLVGATFPKETIFHIGLQLPIYSSLLSFVYVIAFVVFLKTLLTMLERKAGRHPKYFTLLTLMYRELLVGGLINFLSKRLAEFNVFDKDSSKYTAWEATDDMILFFAISIAIQSIIMFLRLRSRNMQLDELAILTPAELYAKATSDGTSSKLGRPYVSAAKMFVLRDFFLREYHLPRLFSFPKYLRAVQDTEIIHLFEVEKSTWVLLVIIQGVFYTIADATKVGYRDELDQEETREAIHKNRLLVLFMLIFVLTALMLGLYLYLKKCVSLMVVYAGGEEKQLATALKHIADVTEQAPHETTEATLLHLIERTENLPEVEDASSFSDLLGTLFRKLTGSTWGKKAPDVAHLECNLHLPLFSRKLVHVVTKFFLTLNAFYFGFLFQAFVVLAGRTTALSLAMIGLQMLLLLVNMTFLSPRIIRQFALINGIVRVNPGELKSVVEHFIDVLQLQRKMVRAVAAHCETHRIDLEQLRTDLELEDKDRSRYIEGDILRQTIKKYGFKFSKHKFNTFVRLQFKTKGTRVRYDLFFRVLFREAAALSIEDGASADRRRPKPFLIPRKKTQSKKLGRPASAQSEAKGSYSRLL